MTTRRNFIKTTSAALGAAFIRRRFFYGPSSPEVKGHLSFGFQTWTLREQLGEDLPGTLKKMAGIGYKEVEFCSPLGYSGTPFEKFNGLKGSELRRIITDAGLKCESSHYGMGELRDHLDNRIEWSLEMGITQIIASSFWLPADASLDDYRRACA